MAYSVYVFLDNKNRPYYVGKTNDMKRRKREHLEEIRNGNTLPKYNAARKFKNQGISFRMRRIAIAKSESDAYRLERYYIKKYRREGYYLLNCTYGGPYEKPMKIVTPKIINPAGIKLPSSKRPKRKPKRKLKNKNRRAIKRF